MKKIVVLFLFSFLLYSCKEENMCTESEGPQCACTYEYDPVCGCNGKTYGNACAAQCRNIFDYTLGVCP